MISQNIGEFDKSRVSFWHNNGFLGKGSIVVVLDDTSKPHNFTNVSLPIQDYSEKIGHKTNVCSVVREVAPECNIIAFSWFGSKKKEIVDWLFENKNEICVVNCSFSDTINDIEFSRMKDLDIPIVVASGNNGNSSLNSLPKLDWTIAVGAWEESRDKRANYSNYGVGLDIVAYTNLYIPTSDGYSRVMLFDGTSCSAPMVSGMLAIYNGWLMENGLPKLNRQQTFEFLRNSTIDKMIAGFDIYSGYGLFVLPDKIPVIVKEEDDLIFKDTNTHWAREYIDFVSEKGLMKGYEDGSFQPDKPVTRAELATVLARMEGFVKK